MSLLRWTLGLIGLVFGVGFVTLAVLGSAFRKSFGASGHSALFIGLPTLGVALLLAAILFPTHKPLLHIAALTALGLAALCLWQIVGEGATPLWFAIGYLGVWFVYYWLAAWRGTAQS